jgi:MFS family permease
MSSLQATARSCLSMPVLGLFAGLTLVQLFNGTVQGYLPPVMPAVGTRLGLTAAGQSRLLMVVVLSATVLVPLVARLGDLYGHRRMLLISVATVAVGSLLIAGWPTPVTLVVGSILQGAAVGCYPLMIGILHSRAPQHSRAGMGLLGGVVMAAVAVGGLVAGVLSEGRAMAGLWVTVPVAVLALGAAWWLPESDGRRVGRFHIGSALVLSVGLVGLTLAVTEGPTWGWASTQVLVALISGVLALVVWILVEARVAHPLVNLRLFRNPQLAPVLGVVFCLSFGSLGIVGANITFLAAPSGQIGYGMGLGPQSIALVATVLLGFAAVSAGMAPLALRHLGERPALAAGAFLTAASFILMVLWHDTLVEYMIGIIVLGLASGLFQVVARTLAVEAVPEHHTALAAGLTELAVGFGATVGAAVISAFLAAHPLGGTRFVTLSAYLWCWWACAAVSVVGFALVLTWFGCSTTIRPYAKASTGRSPGCSS